MTWWWSVNCIFLLVLWIYGLRAQFPTVWRLKSSDFSWVRFWRTQITRIKGELNRMWQSLKSLMPLMKRNPDYRLNGRTSQKNIRLELSQNLSCQLISPNVYILSRSWFSEAVETCCWNCRNQNTVQIREIPITRNMRKKGIRKRTPMDFDYQRWS